MNSFKKRKPKETPAFSAGLPQDGDELTASLKAYSQFVKRVNFSQCGALLSFPVSASQLACPYCRTDNRRV